MSVGIEFCRTTNHAWRHCAQFFLDSDISHVRVTNFCPCHTSSPPHCVKSSISCVFNHFPLFQLAKPACLPRLCRWIGANCLLLPSGNDTKVDRQTTLSCSGTPQSQCECETPLIGLSALVYVHVGRPYHWLLCDADGVVEPASHSVSLKSLLQSTGRHLHQFADCRVGSQLSGDNDGVFWLILGFWANFDQQKNNNWFSSWRKLSFSYYP